jgi:hypothetical protein
MPEAGMHEHVCKDLEWPEHLRFRKVKTQNGREIIAENASDGPGYYKQKDIYDNEVLYYRRQSREPSSVSVHQMDFIQ